MSFRRFTDIGPSSDSSFWLSGFSRSKLGLRSKEAHRATDVSSPTSCLCLATLISTSTS